MSEDGDDSYFVSYRFISVVAKSLLLRFGVRQFIMLSVVIYVTKVYADHLDRFFCTKLKEELCWMYMVHFIFKACVDEHYHH